MVFNHATYITHSRTVINHGFDRPGGPRGTAAGAPLAPVARTNRGTTHSINQACAQRRGARTAGAGREGWKHADQPEIMRDYEGYSRKDNMLGAEMGSETTAHTVLCSCSRAKAADSPQMLRQSLRRRPRTLSPSRLFLRCQPNRSRPRWLTHSLLGSQTLDAVKSNPYRPCPLPVAFRRMMRFSVS